MEELETFVKENEIDIAVLTIPKDNALEVAERLARQDIKGIWNFAHIDLNLSKRDSGRECSSVGFLNEAYL